MGLAVCGSSQSPIQEVTSDIKLTDTWGAISNNSSEKNLAAKSNWSFMYTITAMIHWNVLIKLPGDFWGPKALVARSIFIVSMVILVRCKNCTFPSSTLCLDSQTCRWYSSHTEFRRVVYWLLMDRLLAESDTPNLKPVGDWLIVWILTYCEHASSYEMSM